MKKRVVIISLLSSFVLSNAMLIIKLDCQNCLRARFLLLKDNDLKAFVDSTQLHQTLALQEVSPVQLLLKVNASIAAYNQNYPEQQHPTITSAKIIETLLPKNCADKKEIYAALEEANRMSS